MEKPKILDDLNTRELLYAKYRASEIFSKKDCAAKAGYKEKSAQHAAWELEKRPNVQLAIEYFREKLVEEVDMDVKEIIKRMEQVARKQGAYAEKADNKTCLKALEDLAKIQGVEGLSEVVKIQYDPLDGLKLEEIREIAAGKIPTGRSGAFVEDLRRRISEVIAKKHRASSDGPEE